MKMYLSFLFASALCILSVTVYGQPQKGDLNFNLGIGAGLSYSIGSLSLPPVGVSADYNLDERISLGGIITYAGSSFDFGNGKYKLNYTQFGARANYHFASTEKADPYFGAFLGYRVLSAKWQGTGNDPDYNFSLSTFLPGAYIGARYKLSDTFGIFGELGYPLLRAGISVKM